LKLSDRGLGLDERYHAVRECVELYEELTAYNIMKQDLFFIHQLAVDAYAAQHVGGNMKNITAVFALVGLYLFNEYGYTGRQVQLAHMQLARNRIEWPALAPPEHPWAMNVQDVLAAPEGDERDERLKQWSASVWANWRHQHDWIRSICREHRLVTD